MFNNYKRRKRLRESARGFNDFEKLEEYGITADELSDILANNLIVEDGMVAGHKKNVIHHKGVKFTRVSGITMMGLKKSPEEKMRETMEKNESSSFWGGFWGGVAALFFFGSG